MSWTLLGSHYFIFCLEIIWGSRLRCFRCSYSTSYFQLDDLLGKVRGVVASRRKKGDRVSVWVGDARRLGAVVDVGRMVISTFY